MEHPDQNHGNGSDPEKKKTSADELKSDGESIRSRDHQGLITHASGLNLHEVTIAARENNLLENSSVLIDAGKITVIVGPSGAGKSVLLKTLAGLIPKEGESLSWSGDIIIYDQMEERYDPKTKRQHLGNIGVVFQQFALFDELTSQANIQFALDHAGHARRHTSHIKSVADTETLTPNEWLEQLGVPLKIPIGNLSGGQKQRLAVARTLAASPSVVLYDEPTSGLDAASGGRVAELIRSTHQTHQRTSVVVTHDYPTLLPIADEVIFFNPETKKLEKIPKDQWKDIPVRLDRLRPSQTGGNEVRKSSPAKVVLKGLESTGSVVIAIAMMPQHLLPWFPKWKWGCRFTAHYLRLVAGPSAWIYLIIAGMIIGFTSTFFTFRFLPFRLYTQPLLIDELLASVGFALYRILVPILSTILIAARCGAAVTADVGVKRYGGQTDAIQTMGLKSSTYLLTPILLTFVIATPFLEWLAFEASKLTSLLTFLHTHSEIGSHFWEQNFHLRITERSDAGILTALGIREGWIWVLSKNLLCGMGTAAIAYYRGMMPKQSASDVSASVTSTVLWATLYVLTVHFMVAMLEF